MFILVLVTLTHLEGHRRVLFSCSKSNFDSLVIKPFGWNRNNYLGLKSKLFFTAFLFYSKLQSCVHCWAALTLSFCDRVLFTRRSFVLKIQYDRASSSTKTHVHPRMSYQQLVSVSCAVTETALQHFLIICLEQWVLWHSTRKVNVIHVYIFICLLKVKQTQKGSLFSVI